MKFGVVGIGNHAINRVMPAILESGNEIAGITTANQEKGNIISEKFGCKYYPNYAEMLSSDIDSVYVGSPNFMHFEHVKKGLNNSKNVLVEKQMTLRSADAKELTSLASEKKVKLAVGFHLRMHPAVDYIKKELVKPEDPIIYQSGIWSHTTTAREQIADSKWWSEPDKVGGGSIMGTGVHVIDTLISFNNRFPRKVTAFRIPEEKIIDETMIVNMQFERSFATALSSRQMEGNYNDLTLMTGSNRITCKNFFSTTIDTVLKLNDKEIKKFSGGNLYSSEIDEFVKYVNDEPSKIASGNDGYRVVKVVEEAQRFISMVR